MQNQEKVVIAMSGGVDSSVAAAILVEQGYSVKGIMLKLWADDCGETENSCCPPEAIDQAKQVAGIINIPFYVLDAKEIFKKKIVDYFIDGYRLGITPNPCFYCNKLIRWGYLLDRILDTGATKIATGHYARIYKDGEVFSIQKGVDSSKDQSYVLSGLNQKQLSHSIFPLGGLLKKTVREMAKDYHLPVAEKHDSQDLCFVGKGGYRNFLSKYSPSTFISGDIITTSGEKVGSHNGLVNYTIGQRKGLGAGFTQPMYVIRKDIEKNTLIIGPESELGNMCFSVRLENWLEKTILISPFKCEVKTRYKSAMIKCKVNKTVDEDVQVVLEKKQKDITPGQIAVFYLNDRVIGSGEIQSVKFLGVN